MSQKETKLQQLYKEKNEILERLMYLPWRMRNTAAHIKTLEKHLFNAQGFDVPMFKKLLRLRSRELFTYARHKKKLHERLNKIDHLIKYYSKPPFSWGGFVKGNNKLSNVDIMAVAEVVTFMAIVGLVAVLWLLVTK